MAKKSFAQLLSITTRISLCIWLASLVIFSVLLFGPNKYNSSGLMKEQIKVVYLVDIAIGIIAFLLSVLMMSLSMICKRSKVIETNADEIKKDSRKIPLLFKFGICFIGAGIWFVLIAGIVHNLSDGIALFHAGALIFTTLLLVGIKRSLFSNR